LLPWCRRNKVPLIADIVEWQNPSQLPGGAFGVSFLNIELSMRYLYPKCNGIISISSYLSEYYRRHGCPVVQIPPTIDFSQMATPDPSRSPISNNLTLIYAGDPGKKDLLQPVLEGINMVDGGRNRVNLIVLGPSADQIRNLFYQGRQLPPSIKVLGRVPQGEVTKLLKNADFSVLLRPKMRFATAGFPTKVVESMANGVPVIGNITGDLGCYLRDGINSLVCRDHTAEAFAEALDRGLRMSADDLKRLRLAARSDAEHSFDYKYYSEQLLTLLDKVRLS
jgi:glycosyltransferase involved in cell wall biosynthesis